MNHLGLFEGIGGFSYAASLMGWKTLAWCEWNEFGQKVLRHHFPEAEGFGDITKTDFRKYANRIDILTGGFPCQPYSVAGKRKGKEDERHLWPEMLRAIREIQPTYVVGENVGGLVNWNGGMVFDEVQTDLEAEGYEVQPFILPACAKNAPHRRDRVWFIAYSNRNGHQSREFGENRCKKEKSQSNMQKREWIWNDSRGTCEQGIIADTRCRDSRSDNKSEWASNNSSRCCVENNDANTECTGSQEQHTTTEPNKQGHSTRLFIEKWSNFPIESPVCGGNDGLPERLDNITFPKWRNESIKAYGNAIVPQVALEIFKALDKMINQEIKQI